MINLKTHFKAFNTKEELISLLQDKIVVIDSKVLDNYPFLRGVSKRELSIKDPEAHKNYEGVRLLLNFLQARKVSRSDTLLVIGGGALSDLAGFAASIYKRGIIWEIIPTTLLSFIDASIGGKTGINTEFGKNLVGSFYMPKIVYQTTYFFKTLKESEIKSGYGELLKYAFLSSEIYQKVKNKNFNEAFFLSSNFKNNLVLEDPYEKDKRKLLNLGHTVGHAIELITHEPHGVCVSYGLEIILKIYNEELLSTFYNLRDMLDLPHFSSVEDKKDLKKYLEQDKKIIKDEIDLIIPSRVGVCEIKRVALDSFIQSVYDKI